MKVVWDEISKREYETGVDKAVLFVYKNSAYQPGVAWSGITSISDNPSGAEASPIYADNIKYLNLISAEDYGAAIEAYTYPDEFAECDGSQEIATGVTVGQQTRKSFGLCYRTLIGNDTDGTDHGYKLHIIYGCMAAPSEKQYQTVNDSPEAISLSWDITTTPVNIAGFKPTACITINSTKIPAAKLAQLEDIIYGTDTVGETEGTESRLPMPAEIISLVGISA